MTIARAIVKQAGQPRMLADMDLVGVAEVAEMFGVSRQRADQLLRQKGAPEPVAVLTAGRVYDLADIKPWLRKVKAEIEARRRK